LERLNCSVCIDKAADSVMMPCGHGGLCNECAIMMWQRTESCYLCRSSIEKVVQIPETPSVWIKPKSTTERQPTGLSTLN
jgi:hypothetical protein